MKSSEISILARLAAAIEQQNRHLLELLAKLSGENVAPQKTEDGITTSRRMEIIQMAHEVSRSPEKKKPSNREARA